MLGIIKDRVYKKYEKESSKLKMIKGGAWTINLDKVDITAIDLFVYETKKYIYSISTRVARNVGLKLLLGGEMKLVVVLEYWQKLKKEK